MSGGIFLPPTWHGIPAKAFQVSFLRCPPATVFPQKYSRCPFPLSTCYGFPAKACQVFLSRCPPGTESPQKRFRCPFSAAHLLWFSRKSVPGVSSCLPPATVFPQKCSRCLILPPTWHGIPAKVFQVTFLASHLARYSRKSVPGDLSRLPPGTVFPQKCSRCPFPLSTRHGIPAKAFQVSLPVVHLARFSCKSVPGSTSCLPPATVFLQKRGRCPFPAVHLPRYSCKSVPGGISPLFTWHGIPAKAWQVAPLIAHLTRQFLSSWDVGAFQQDMWMFSAWSV